MRQILLILSILTTGFVSAEIDPSRPLLTVANEFGVPIAGITKSTTELAAAAKISKLPDGTYYILRPPIVIIVKHEFVVPNIAPVAITGGDQIVKSGQMVFLPCNLSHDPDGEIVKCEYVQTGGTPVNIQYLPTGEAYYIAPNVSNDIKT